jgi:hypothetical protein
MRTLKKVLAEVPNQVGPADLDRVERWFDENGSAAKAFEASLRATGVMRADLLKVVAAVTAVVNGGLTREALTVLLQARIGNQRNDAHRLKEPRVYVDSAYRNEEMIAVRKLLMGAL